MGSSPRRLWSFSPTGLLIPDRSQSRSPSPVTVFDGAARSVPAGRVRHPNARGVVTDVTVSSVHMGQDSAAAPKIKTKTAPAQPFKALLHLDESDHDPAHNHQGRAPGGRSDHDPGQVQDLDPAHSPAHAPAPGFSPAYRGRAPSRQTVQGRASDRRRHHAARGLHFVRSDSDDI